RGSTVGTTAAYSPFPFWRCHGNVLLNREPAKTCNGRINQTDTVQHNAGVSAQATLRSDRGGQGNQFTWGGALDRSSVAFVQSTELGYLNPDRSITGVHAFGDGVTGGQLNGEPYDTRVSLDGLIHTFSLYATDT